MTTVDTFGVYVRAELEHWGEEFALWRDCDYLGHASKNMLKILIDHRGEMPPPNVGYKPLEIDLRAQLIEDIVADIGRDQVVIASVLRAFYCGSGRRKVERWETANALIERAGHKAVSQRSYLSLHDLGVAQVRGVLRGIAVGDRCGRKVA